AWRGSDKCGESRHIETTGDDPACAARKNAACAALIPRAFVRTRKRGGANAIITPVLTSSELRPQSIRRRDHESQPVRISILTMCRKFERIRKQRLEQALQDGGGNR